VSEGAAKKEEKPRKFQAIRGTRDLLPPETALWNRVEQTAHAVFGTFGFGEIRMPIFEQTDLFARSIGRETDVVSKEMYTFEDFDVTELSELRTSILAWRYVPRDFSTFSIFQSQAMAYINLAGKQFERGEVPKSPENHNLLKEARDLYESFVARVAGHDYDGAKSRLAMLKDAIRQFKLGDQLTLRPEATASVCRAYIEHGMQQLPQPVKLYYMGPMFRRERPQKGRYRQFYQIGAEVLEAFRPDVFDPLKPQEQKSTTKDLAKDAAIDAEVIEMVMTFFDRLELQGVQLDINSIGCRECRPKYVELLRAELLKVKDKLGPDSQRRIETNPLRMLDSKLESEQGIIAALPRIADHLCEACATHYAAVKYQLEMRGVFFRENWRLVRGLDYYMRTTFEITAQGLGSQNAVCGGGRYDGLVELLGGPPTKGIGFAIGEDRLILSLQESGECTPPAVGNISAAISGKATVTGHAHAVRALDVYIAWMGERAHATAIRAAKDLRKAGFSIELPPVELKFGKALGQADKLGAKHALILGDNEVASGEWTLKTLADGSQIKFTEPDLLEHLRKQKAVSS
jgi:histidyl-tRNA synthetase